MAIISAPRRQIAFKVVPLSLNRDLQALPELAEITMVLSLLKTSGYTSVPSAVAQLSFSAVYGTTDASFHHARHLIMHRHFYLIYFTRC